MPEPTAQIENSILHDIKQLLGQEWDDPTYDLDIKIHINAVFSNLNDIGVGPAGGFKITGPETLWTAFTAGVLDLEDVKTYVYYRCRLGFDPPNNGFLVTNLQEAAQKLEWTLMVKCDPIPAVEVPEGELEPVTTGDIDGMFS
jgi:hypothetical protein